MKSVQFRYPERHFPNRRRAAVVRRDVGEIVSTSVCFLMTKNSINKISKNGDRGNFLELWITYNGLTFVIDHQMHDYRQNKHQRYDPDVPGHVEDVGCKKNIDHPVIGDDPSRIIIYVYAHYLRVTSDMRWEYPSVCACVCVCVG